VLESVSGTLTPTWEYPPQDFYTAIQGTFTASQLLFRIRPTRNLQFAENMGGCALTFGAPAEAEAVCTIYKNGTEIGTGTVSASDTVTVWSAPLIDLTGGASGADLFEIFLPLTPDTTLAEADMSLTCLRLD
jgi:hypothetical protein